MSEANGVSEMDDPRQILQLSAFDLNAGAFAEALERLRGAFSVLEKSPEFLAPSRALEARALMSLGREDEAVATLEKAIGEAKQAGLEKHVVGLRGLREQLHRAVEMRRLAATPVDELSGRHIDPGERAVLFANKIVAYLGMGDISSAEALLPRARASAEEADDPLALLPVLLATSQLGAAQGDWTSAKKALDAARTLAKLHDPESMVLVEEMTRYLMQHAPK
jgi:tetratricopeptide (TPR) repeat protein